MRAPLPSTLLVVSLAACAVHEEPTPNLPRPAVAAPAPPPPSRALAVASSSQVALPASALLVADPTCKQDPRCAGESCCARLAVPGGQYDDKKAGLISVRGFHLDKYELTVGRVKAWVAAGMPVPHADSLLGHDSAGRPVRWGATWRATSKEKLRGWERYDTWRVGKDDLPKNFIDWYTAAAVCSFAGGRLPTDAEWRYVAVGGDEDRPFPWGNEPQTPERAVYNCMGDGDKSCSLADVVAVGSKPLGVGRWGHHDLAGSMFEWTLDAGGTDGTVARGGGFCYIGGQDRRSTEVKAFENVRRDKPHTVSHMVGARCAYDLEPTSSATASR